MPWSTPQLREVRSLVRDNVRASLPGADANVPNSVLRVLSDAQGGLCHLTLQYIDWLALQLLPDTAEDEWLDRHGVIWLVNADGTKGRKQATFANGEVLFTGVDGSIVPAASQLSNGTIDYETTLQITIGSGPTEASGAGARRRGHRQYDGGFFAGNDHLHCRRRQRRCRRRYHGRRRDRERR